MAAAFGLHVSAFTPFTSASSNANYLLETQQGRVVLTIVAEAGADAAQETGRLLAHLAAHAFPTSRPISPLSGAVFAEYQGRALLAKAYIPGAIVPFLDPVHLAQVGRAMANLHRIPPPPFLAGKLPYGRQEAERVCAQDIDPPFADWLSTRLPALEEALDPALPQGLIHADLFADNVLFSGANLAAIIDFESALDAPFVFDLGMAIVGLCAGETRRAAPLLRGYETLRPLQPGEKAALQQYAKYAATTVACWRFWQYHLNYRVPAYAEKHWEMVAIAEAIRRVPADQFLEQLLAS